MKSISTGSIQLDHVLGGDGIPTGRITEIFGDQSSGKTTLALELVQSVQEQGGRATYVDAEHSLDLNYARKIGVRPGQLMFSQPDTGEEGLDVARELADTGAMDLIVVDSAAALVPGDELEEGFDEQSSRNRIRMLSGALRKLSPCMKRSETAMVFTNQVRTRLNPSFGPDETTPGGNALKFYTSVRIQLEHRSSIERNETVVGNRVRARVVKNRTAPPNRSVELDLLFDRGICPYGDLLDAARTHNVIQSGSSGFSFRDTPLGPDRDAVRERLKNDRGLHEKLQVALENTRSNEDRESMPSTPDSE